jgi:hypothetical protein
MVYTQLTGTILSLIAETSTLQKLELYQPKEKQNFRRHTHFFYFPLFVTTCFDLHKSHPQVTHYLDVEHAQLFT